MFSISLKRSVATLGIVAGLLAAAVPASAQGGGADFTRLQGQVPQQPRATITMLDYEGSPVVASSPKDGPQAYMTDVIWQGYANPAHSSNEVAVEGITLAHEGFEIQALGTRGGGEVSSSDSY
jgi:hypothetical protein